LDKGSDQLGGAAGAIGVSEQLRFHLSIPAPDLDVSVRWYVQVLGCRTGRRSPLAAILDLHGHQLVLQQSPALEPLQQGIYPRHFGVIFNTIEPWQCLRDQITAAAEPFAVPPKCRFRGELLEHWTFFLKDPGGNWLEFKHYSQPEAVLQCTEIAAVGDQELR
jgi:extradiol dioxygenase family protein